MNIRLSYGRQFTTFSFPATAVTPEFNEPQYTINRDVFMQDMLNILPAEKDNFRQVAVVVSDKTRLCGYPAYLPWLINVLTQRGAKKKNITFYIAYGTHPRQSGEESYKSYGPVYGEYQFVHHDCRDDSLFENLGTSIRGTSVLVRKDIRHSTLVITFGAISHHYFAGYGGGRKLLFPGLGARESVYHNHSLFLDHKTRSLASGCQPGNLEGNPLAEDLREIDSLMPPRISIHGILNSSGKVCQLILGKSYGDFIAACKVHDSYYRLNSAESFDLVVASSGGYPKDINFIQAHKSLHHAAAFVKDGGRLVILSECADKIGSDYFIKYLQAGSFEAAFSMLENNYEGNGGTALSLMGKTSRIGIYMMTSLEEDICNTLGVKKVAADDIEKIISSEKGKMAVIRNASILVR